MKNIFKIDKRGFTLVELLIVVVILTLLIVITGTTVFPLMGKTQKTGMTTYAAKVLSNAMASVQADSITGNSDEGYYYKISKLMDDRNDYYGCVKAIKGTDGDYDYEIKMFSSSQPYYIYAAQNQTDDIPGQIESNGTITIDLDTEVEYIVASSDPKNVTQSNVEDNLCDQDDFSTIGVDGYKS